MGGDQAADEWNFPARLERGPGHHSAELSVPREEETVLLRKRGRPASALTARLVPGAMSAAPRGQPLGLMCGPSTWVSGMGPQGGFFPTVTLPAPPRPVTLYLPPRDQPGIAVIIINIFQAALPGPRVADARCTIGKGSREFCSISRVEILLPFLLGLAHLGLSFPTHKGEGANTCPGGVVRWWVSDQPPQTSRTQVSQELARKVGSRALPRPAESEVPGLGSVISMNTTPGGPGARRTMP